MFDYLVSSYWNSLGRIKRNGLGGSMPLGASFEFSKDSPFLASLFLSLPPTCGLNVSSELLLQCHGCLLPSSVHDGHGF